MTISHLGGVSPRFSAQPMVQYPFANRMHEKRISPLPNKAEPTDTLSLGHVSGTVKSVNLAAYPTVNAFLQAHPRAISVSHNGRPDPYLVLNLKSEVLKPDHFDKIHSELTQMVRKNKHLKGLQVRSYKVETVVPFVQNGFKLEKPVGFRKRNAQVETLLNAAVQQHQGKNPSLLARLKGRMLGLNLKKELSEQLPLSANYLFQVVLFKPLNTQQH